MLELSYQQLQEVFKWYLHAVVELQEPSVYTVRKCPWLEYTQVSLPVMDILETYQLPLIVQARMVSIRYDFPVNCTWIWCTVPEVVMGTRLYFHWIM